MGKSEKTQAYFEAMGERIEQGEKFTEGQLEAYWTWFYSRNREEIVEDGHLWCRDVHDFIQTMREAGVESFVTTDQSTGLMGNLHGFVDEGCIINSVCMVKPVSKLNPYEKGIKIIISRRSKP